MPTPAPTIVPDPWDDITYPHQGDRIVLEERRQDVRDARLFLWHRDPEHLATLQQARRLAFIRWARLTHRVSDWP